MIGKFLISMTFAIAYLYTAELFPTPVRNVAVGAASTFARIGSMSAPYIVDLLVSILFCSIFRSKGIKSNLNTLFGQIYHIDFICNPYNLIHSKSLILPNSNDFLQPPVSFLSLDFHLCLFLLNSNDF